MAAIWSGVASGNDNWPGYNIRDLLAVQNLLGAKPGAYMVRCTVAFGSSSGTNSTMDGAWLGQQNAAVQPYNMDGNQIQFTFSGATTITDASGALVVISDWVGPFIYTMPRNLIFSTSLGNNGANNAFSQDVTGQIGNLTYWLLGPSQAAVTAPTGSWSTNAAGQTSFLASLEMMGTRGRLYAGMQPMSIFLRKPVTTPPPPPPTNPPFGVRLPMSWTYGP